MATPVDQGAKGPSERDSYVPFHSGVKASFVAVSADSLSGSNDMIASVLSRCDSGAVDVLQRGSGAWCGWATALLERAREKNADDGLTGVLLFNPNYFLQCLEGGREAVTAAFCRIAADRRHTNVTLVSVHDIEARDFPDWTMGYLGSTSSDVSAVLREFLPTEEFTPRLLRSASAIELMKRIRGMNGTG